MKTIEEIKSPLGIVSVSDVSSCVYRYSWLSASVRLTVVLVVSVDIVVSACSPKSCDVLLPLNVVELICGLFVRSV